MTTITVRRHTATIRNQDGRFFVLVTRDGDCLPGIKGRFYATAKAAENGARRMIDLAECPGF